jgi:hypothetical protein
MPSAPPLPRCVSPGATDKRGYINAQGLLIVYRND